jgi:membrane-bound lytic murein transglycosylase B
MPSQISAYGVDADRDGHINLFSEDDALYSVANYLRAHGWTCGISAKRQYRVILAYNHSNIYANTVLGVAGKLKQKGGDKPVMKLE